VRPVRLAAVLGSAAVVAACQAGVPRPGPAGVVSNYERATGSTVSRDCGYSSPLPGPPGRSLWLFCDTEIAGGRGGTIQRLILGTDTAAAGPYRPGRAPARLSELPTPPSPARPGDGAPQPFLPAPPGLLLPGSTLPCAGPGAYPASWISGVTPEAPGAGPGELLISYDDYCVTGSDDAQTAEGFGLVAYDPRRNLLGPPALVFGSLAGIQLPAQQVLGSPLVAADGYLYLFGFCHAAGCAGVFLVRTPAQPGSWRNPLTYQYWTGLGWSPDAAAAGPLAIPAGGPLGISAGDYAADGRGLVMVEQTTLAGGFQVWQAGSPAGPWRRILAGRVPCRRGAQRGTGALCRAIIGHPELSTRRQLFISYFDPGRDHVEVSGYAW
jgi:hypothetical protein